MEITNKEIENLIKEYKNAKHYVAYNKMLSDECSDAYMKDCYKNRAHIFSGYKLGMEGALRALGLMFSNDGDDVTIQKAGN